MPDAERRVVRGRFAGMQLHPSFNRKFRDPFSSVASWQIDDCARAVQCFLPMLLRPARSGRREMPLLCPEVSKQAFGHLKRFNAFHQGHVQYDTEEEYKAAAKAAVQELIQYGALMETVSTMWMLTMIIGCWQPLSCNARVHFGIVTYKHQQQHPQPWSVNTTNVRLSLLGGRCAADKKAFWEVAAELARCFLATVS
jgi:hypothetical protein